MSKPKCIVRPATDVTEALDLWWPFMQLFAWNRASEDITLHYVPGSFLVAAAQDNPDKAEGCIVPFVFSNGTGWVGFFCMNPSKQGLGWGAALFNAGLDHFNKHSALIVGLDAVQQQVGTYGRRGFVEKGRIRLMSCTFGQESMSRPPKDAEFDGRKVELQEVHPSVLTKSDLAHTGLRRDDVWDRIWERDGTVGYALVRDKQQPVDSMDELDGWVLVRTCEDGFRVGPLYATSPRAASFLLTAAMEGAKTKFPEQAKKAKSFVAETWLGNAHASSIFDSAGFAWVGVDYHRMWLNGVVPEAQQAGGRADTDAFAMFDAGQG
ncbi:hypothetical protein EJ06DRAFT_556501 [Trichodelitschia bisporula]|uniref:N-acetyltransferase domain-containing protein n=1 Tax=Trichodelitschia bisporula TaxID=703511 RepID=A0A6G1HYR1_9PEZI|nr:hypothetical protein EJ06DRAFT_556501 [Trichodelitschia bisporula]